MQANFNVTQSAELAQCISNEKNINKNNIELFSLYIS